MRTSPLLGQKAWFGPRRFGWGLGPRSPEGWIVAATATIAGVAAAVRWPNRPVLRSLPVATFIAVAILKGTSPGGPKEWRKLARREV